MQLVKHSYNQEDVTFLLKDVEGKVEILPTEEREKRIQKGVHYSEMLPLEELQSDEYMSFYNASMNALGLETAKYVAILGTKIFSKLGEGAVLVSLARAGTPVGVLLKRFIKLKYGVDVPHYSISIIRGKGVDSNALKYIVEKHCAEGVVFVDGWVGKGAITCELQKSCSILAESNPIFKGLDPELAVISDPAYTTDLCGTHEDFLIPSACLNSLVSGLVSRTCEKGVNATKGDFHGAVYFGHLAEHDLSRKFVDTISSYFSESLGVETDMPTIKHETFHGIDEIKEIAEHFGIDDINKIKPGVGETTRVLLRRMPWKVLVKDLNDTEHIEHILQLCKDKQVPVVEYPLQRYRICGIIKDMSADA